MELFVFDIDGTLVSDFGEITKPVIEAINQLLERGDAVAIASGRCYSGVKHYLDCLVDSPNKYALGSNGAVVSRGDGKVLAKNPLKYSDFLYIAQKYGKGITVPYFYKDNWLGTFKPKEKVVKMEITYNHMDGIIDLNKTPLKDDDEVDKALIAAFPLHSIWIEKHLDPADKEKYNICRSSDIFLEFMRKGVDKATGIGELITLIGLTPDHVHTFGDSMNDEQMIKEFDGTAMGNALEPIKKVAKRITKPVKEDGIAFALKTWFGVK